MIKLDDIYSGSGKMVCDVCGREVTIEDFNECPDGWSIFVDNGRFVNVCYDPDCKKAIDNIFMNEMRCLDE